MFSHISLFPLELVFKIILSESFIINTIIIIAISLISNFILSLKKLRNALFKLLTNFQIKISEFHIFLFYPFYLKPQIQNYF